MLVINIFYVTSEGGGNREELDHDVTSKDTAEGRLGKKRDLVCFK